MLSDGNFLEAFSPLPAPFGMAAAADMVSRAELKETERDESESNQACLPAQNTRREVVLPSLFGVQPRWPESLHLLALWPLTVRPLPFVEGSLA